MKYSINECSIAKTFDGIETGQLFIRRDGIDNILYLKGRRQAEDVYVDLETGDIFPMTAFDSKGKDIVFPITDYELSVYFSKEV